MYWTRSVGGGLFILGWVLMVYNLWRTVRAGTATDGEAEVTALVPAGDGSPAPSTARLVFGAPFLLGALGLLAGAMIAAGAVLAPVGLALEGRLSHPHPACQ